MKLQAALNGARMIDEHAMLPATPAQLAHDTASALAAGAEAVHFHVRRADGQESLEPVDVAEALSAVRALLPDVEISVSTAAWIVGDAERRHALVQQWYALPTIVSLNFAEAGAAELAQMLLDRGVGIEAGLDVPEAALVLITSAAADRCVRILLEPGEDDPEAALATVAAIEAILDEHTVAAPRLLHGRGATTWPLVHAARQRGYATRIGLEDTTLLPDGSIAHDNAALVAAALEIMNS